MVDKKTHYPGFDIMNFKDDWDPLTREILQKRLGPFPKLEYLTEEEEKMLRLIIRHITYDNRDDILDWIIYYMDQRLKSEIGEMHRKPNTPPEKILIREGLKTLDKLSATSYNNNFVSVEIKDQFDLLASIQLGKATPISEWKTIPQKDFFNKLLELIINAYYSHPTIWSEIGYGGPAYPRGYYRIELGWTDPWEPRRKSFSGSDSNGEAKKDGK